MQRTLDKRVSLIEGLDHVVKVAEERGYSFGRDDLVTSLIEALPKGTNEEVPSSRLAQLLIGEAITTGTLGFKSLRIGLSNPTLVMCQYHAPMAILAEKSISERLR